MCNLIISVSILDKNSIFMVICLPCGTFIWPPGKIMCLNFILFCLPKVKYSQLKLKTSVANYSVPLQDYKVPSIVVSGGVEIVNFLHFDESGKILLVSSSTLSPNSYPHPLHTTHNINTHKTPNVNTYSLLISCLMKNSTLANSTPHLWHSIKIANERNNLHTSQNPNLEFGFWNWVQAWL